MSKFPSLPWTDAAARWLQGKPSLLLSAGLLAIAGFCIWLALDPNVHPLGKALAIAWFLLP